jgi:hypothetical protein
VTYKNAVFAALFQINHNIHTDIITAYLQKIIIIRHFIKYFRILKFIHKYFAKHYCVLNVLIVNKIFCKIKINELQ